jgi:predicted pyridoxine 5'-phosphate oxidase superfamily flavin-nucleotide-binding protein
MGAIGPEARRVVEWQRLSFVATVNDDGTPNLSPKGTIGVLDDDHLIFGDIRSPRTVENLRRRPAVEINVVDPIGRKGYRFRGRATIVDPGPRYDELVESFRARGLVHRYHTFVVIDVEHAEPVLSPVYDDGLTEDEVRARWRWHYTDLETDRSGQEGGR